MLCALALALVLPTACSQAPPEPGVLTVAIFTSPNNFDPRYGTDSVSVRTHRLIFNTLVNLDDNMRASPGLASSWETDDYQTYRFHLHKGVRFHDGHELTSKDVVYTFENILDPASSSPLRGGFQIVKAVTAVDPYTVEFVLKEPSGVVSGQSRRRAYRSGRRRTRAARSSDRHRPVSIRQV